MDEIEIIIGTYENILIGFNIQTNVDGTLSLESSFTDDSHRGAIRCLAVSPSGVLASSSTDDSVRLHNLKKRKEIGSLFQHSGTVNCIRFFQRSHMFSSSEDGTICMWKCKNWEMLRTLKGHKAHVLAVAVHPSGKLGLSVGSDQTLFTWDFVTGKLAFRRKIEQVAQDILFTENGDHYMLVFNRKIQLCSMEDTQVVQEVTVSSRINNVVFLQGDIVVVSSDDRHALLVNMLTGKTLLTLDAAKPGEDHFDSRIRCSSVVHCEENTYVLLATTSGNIKVFKVEIFEDKASCELFLFYEAQVRITSVTVFDPALTIRSQDNPGSEKSASKAEISEEQEEEEISSNEEETEDKEEAEKSDDQEKGKTPKKKLPREEQKSLKKRAHSTDAEQLPSSKSHGMKKKNKKTSEKTVSRKKLQKLQR